MAEQSPSQGKQRSDKPSPAVGKQTGKNSKESPSVTPKTTDKPPKRSGSSGGRRQKKAAARSEQKAALQAAKKKGRERNGKGGGEDIAVQVAGLVIDSPHAQNKGTGIAFDDRCVRHHCPVDSEHGKAECPERYTVCMEKLRERGLVDRCTRIPGRPITDEEILSLHSQEYLDKLKSVSTLPPDELQKLAETFDSVYLCNESFDLVRLSAGNVMNLVEKVVKGEVTNGFAIVRPPGHHCQRDKADGYSILNHVALAAKKAITEWDLQRVLIVDWDIHHGQGIQYFFEEDPRVMYFSMHRYENRDFWPHLEESNYDHIGTGAGAGYNINIPWNKTGMGDAEYLSAFENILLPLAYEYNPQLVLVCCGFDSAVNDPKGEMVTTPECFAHLTQRLMSLADGKLVLSLAGGYHLETLAEGTAQCTASLLGDSCPTLPPLPAVCDNARETLKNVIKALQPHWNCFKCQIIADSELEPIQSGDVSSTTPDTTLDTPAPKGGGEGRTEPGTDVGAIADRLQTELSLSEPPHRTGLVYDERMKLHMTFNHPERPERVSRIFTKHQEHGLLERCFRIQSREATIEELETCHGPSMVADIKETSKYTARELIDKQDDFNSIKYSRDIYVHPSTYLSACVAAGCCLNLVDAVLTNQVLNAVGIVRPPGHHADSEKVSGFCFFNNVAIASKYAQNKYGIKRILILDWDVHHGNGTQRIFESDPSVLYVSLHRHDDGFFYPMGPEGEADQVGKGDGTGFNVNIGWNTRNRGGMGDAEYLAAFHRIVMPLAHQFSPELVFISAGFDAAKGDPLGGCLVSPEGYGHMTHMLNSLAGGRVITVLEGGYNLHSIAVSMAMCTSVMLGDPCPNLTPDPPARCAMQAIYDTAKAHQDFWPSMKVQVALLESMIVQEEPKKEPVSADSETSPGASKESDEAISSSVPSPKDSSVVHPAPIGEDDFKREVVEEGGLEALAEGMSHMNIATPKGGGGNDACSSTKEDVTDDAALGACGWSEPSPKPAAAGGPTVADIMGDVINVFGSDVEMHAVIPQPWCPHLATDVSPLPPGGLDVRLPCEACDDPKENWVCLKCYQVHCGRYVNEHMLMHGLEHAHLMVLSFSDLSVWCYACEAYIHNEVLLPAKRSAHISKFGQDIEGM